MKTRFWLALVLPAALATVSPAWAELAAPNAAGVSMGNVRLAATDVEASRKFFLTLGGTPVSNGTLQLIQFPGVFINVREGKPTGGSVGSNLDHFGFHVKNLAATLETMKALGVKVTLSNNPAQAFLTAPDDVKIELLEDKNQGPPVEMHHVHMFVTAPLEVQAWYAKNFGAVAGKRGNFDVANLPGGELTFTKVDAVLAPTKGRAVDHFGLEVKNLAETVKRLEAAGVKMDRPPQLGANGVTRIALFVDPWGTYVELSEGMAPKK
jgi:catechol 2,3-dioxygenase-like lactoylglutathione lyase family enzyme